MQVFAAANRNREPILHVLKQFMRTDVKMNALEVASGTGQHVVYFAEHFPNVHWQPTENDPKILRSIEAHIQQSKLSNILKPVLVDITQPYEQWPALKDIPSLFDVIYNCNMIHIAPWETAIGLFGSAKKLLKSEGYVILYGPFAVDGAISAESNVRFDKSLKSSNPLWGLRDTRNVIKLAEDNGIEFQKISGERFSSPMDNSDRVSFTLLPLGDWGPLLKIQLRRRDPVGIVAVPCHYRILFFLG